MEQKYTKDKLYKILNAHMGNNSFTTEGYFRSYCRSNYPDLGDKEITKLLASLENEFFIRHDSDGRLYRHSTYREEHQIACRLHTFVDSGPISSFSVEEHKIDGLDLSEEQNEAIAMANNHHLSLVLGHTGSGRATLLRALSAQKSSLWNILICAPDAKSANDLSARIGRPVEALEVALGREIPDPRPSRDWALLESIIVWDSQRVSLQLFDALLERRKSHTRIVLFGDTNDIQSDTPGSLLQDLMEIGIPAIRLHGNYRNILHPTALVHNIANFDNVKIADDFHFDASFMVSDVPDGTFLKDHLARIYATSVSVGENVQVITPYGKRGNPFAAYDLGNSVYKATYGYDPNRRSVLVPLFVWDKSRVMVLRDDWSRNCRAGDIGTLRCISTGERSVPNYCVEFDDGRVAYWDPLKADFNVTLAHALTPNQAKNNWFDVVIVPLSESHPTPSRKDIYSAMVRARKKIIFVGNRNVLNKVLGKRGERQSSLAIRFNDLGFATK